MKFPIRLLLSCLALLLLPSVSQADISTTSPHQVGFWCPPYTNTFVEGSFYQVSATTTFCTWQVGAIPATSPPTPHFGGLFKGIVGSSTGFGNFMGFASQTSLTVSAPVFSNPQQGDSFFGAIWEQRSGPAFNDDTAKFMSFFTTGANPPPTNGWGVINWKWGETPDDSPDPVVIIPGILGSQEHNGAWEIDPILHTYDDLVATLDINHYTLGVDLFTFPYDWRSSNVDTALLLKQKIDEVKDICSCGKIDLVAHSMGGLVARQYIQSDDYEDDVDQLIFLGTPHLGAPKAYLMWEAGEVGPFLPISGTLTERVLEQEASEKGYVSLFAYIRNEPIHSVQELLPIYDYIFDGNNIRQYSTNYPINSFLESLNSNINKLDESNVRTYNLIGETGSQKTINGLQVINTDKYLPLWEHGFPEGYYDLFGDNGLVFGSGDETVPIASASFVNSNILITSYPHNALPTGTEGEIFNILTGETAETLSREYDSLPKKILHILMRSPADLLVIAPDGKKIGKENNQEVNDIPNAFYTGFNTDTEFITILNPIDGEYKIYTEGTDGGSYTVETAYISEELTVEASFTGNTTLGKITELITTIDNESPETLELLPSALTELLALLKQKVEGLDIKEKLKKDLLKKIENLEKKIEKKKEKNAKIIEKLEKKVVKKADKEKIEAADAEEILTLLEELEAQVEDVTLDADILATLKEKIKSLDIKKGLKNDLLKRVEKLENQQALTKSLSNLSKKIMKKGEKGKIGDADAQELLDLLEQIESAL